MGEERVVSFRPRAVLQVVGIVLGIALGLWIVWVGRHVLVWVLISIFLAMALNPAVERLQAAGIKRRGLAAACVYLIALAVVAGLAALLIPTLVNQVNDFVDAIPGYVHDLTKGRGPLGFLERDYHVVERVRDAVSGNSGQIAGGASTALSITKSIVTTVVAVVTIVFMTFFMLLEGPTWVERFYNTVPAGSRERWRRVGSEIYHTVGGYVTGNLVISFIAGAAATLVMLALGIPFALALGLLVAVLDLIPLAGATLGAIIVCLVALTVSPTDCLILAGFFLVYQQLENHLLQPLVYGRTVKLSPLVVLIAVLLGAELAGVVGALGAIPVASTIQILFLDWLAHRPSRVEKADGGHPSAPVLHNGGVTSPEQAKRSPA
jgi:predicted PurR-regulated permease PerM